MGDAEMDCDAVIEEMYTFLDGELTASQRITITSHLHGCVDCHEVIDFHAELKLVIAQRCTERVPAGLEERIRQTLASGDHNDPAGGIPRL